MRTHARSFAGGEISPDLYGRLDLDKFQTGLATCKNFIILPHGPAENRTGFSYVLTVKNSTKKVRLIPFSFNTEQTFTIEFGDGYVRFHTQGGTVLETGQDILAISQAATGILEYDGADPTNGQWFFLSGIGGMTDLNGRYVKVANVDSGANTFELTDLNDVAIDTSGYAAFTSGGTIARVYEIASPFAEADLFDIHYVQSADVLTLVHPSYAPRELRRSGATNWAFTTISFVPTLSAPGSVAATATTGSGSITYTYVVTAIADESLEESVASTSDDCTNNLATSGNKNTITWAAVTGAVRYNVYKDNNGLYGYIGQTSGLSFIDDNIIADVTRTPPLTYSPFDATNKYPSAVSYYEQRRWFGGTNGNPQNLWATRSATESNLSYSIPTQDDDSIVVRIAARDVNSIRHIIPLSDLVLLTSGGEWRVEAQNSDVITPLSIGVKPQSYIGANNVQPVLTGNSVVYIQAQGSKVRDLSYNWESNAYRSEDLSLLASHLFEPYLIVDMAHQRSPVPIIWFVRDDGVLLGLTYLPTQRIWAIHQHETQGLFESVCVVSEGNEDVLYALVKRTIDGETRRFVERMQSRQLDTLADSFFVDAGLTYEGSATTSVTGLWHLEGETVTALADGAVVPTQTVTNGSITVPQASSKIHVGLSYDCDIKTLPAVLEQVQAFGQGRVKNVNSVFLRVYQSSGIFAGPDYDKLRPYVQRTTEPYGSPPNWKSEEIEIVLTPTLQKDGSICIRQSDPLPMTLLSITFDYAVGG